MIFNISDIKIGDEIIFYSTASQSNHDEYWTVTGITGNNIRIKLEKFGINDYWTVDIKDVVGHIKIP